MDGEIWAAAALMNDSLAVMLNEAIDEGVSSRALDEDVDADSLGDNEVANVLDEIVSLIVDDSKEELGIDEPESVPSTLRVVKNASVEEEIVVVADGVPKNAAKDSIDDVELRGV